VDRGPIDDPRVAGVVVEVTKNNNYRIGLRAGCLQTCMGRGELQLRPNATPQAFGLDYVLNNWRTMKKVGIRAGATDLTDPDSYVLQIILIENNEPVVQPTQINTLAPQRIQTQEDLERLRAEQRERLVDQREKQKAQAEADKRKARKAKERPTTKKRVKEPKTTIPAPTEPVGKKTTKAQQVIRLNEIRLRELELLRAEYDDKLIGKVKYNKEKQRIIKTYEDAFKKLRTGGII
jgi:hypothetical protein